jgi:hypothetical protein
VVVDLRFLFDKQGRRIWRPFFYPVHPARLYGCCCTFSSLMVTSQPRKITFGELREMGVSGVLIYCRDHPLQPLRRDERRAVARSLVLSFEA